MGHINLARAVKKEIEELQVQVPDIAIEDCPETHHRVYAEEPDVDIMDELEGILDIDEVENLQKGSIYGQFNWDFMACDVFPIHEEGDSINSWRFCREDNYQFSIKQEEHAYFEDDRKKLSLNLSLNYQDVLEAWSDRTLWADDTSFLSANDASYGGEVPVMDEDLERRRRKASVLRYKEKRRSRLFSKKIRYQVRKLNADKRPRLKGRFVKPVPEKKLK